MESFIISRIQTAFQINLLKSSIEFTRCWVFVMIGGDELSRLVDLSPIRWVLMQIGGNARNEHGANQMRPNGQV